MQPAKFPPTPPTTPPHLPPSRFHCLQVRLLYEKCGHIETLTIHELPCSKLYWGWLPETSPYIKSKPCPGMSRHIALKHAGCARCKVSVPVKRTGLFGGWGKTVEIKERSNALPIREIVARREEWLRGIEVQEERRRRRKGERG